MKPIVDEPTSVLDAERLLQLRRFPGFQDVAVDDAALLLGAMTERALAPGEVLARRGAPLGAAWFVVEGALEVESANHPRTVSAPDMVGMLELMSGDPDGLGVVCASSAVVLELEQADLLAILASDFDMLARSMLSLCRGILMLSPHEGGPVSPVFAQRRIEALSFVDALLLIHELSPFGAVGAETMAELAASFTEVSLSGVVEARGQVTERVLLVLEGELTYGPVVVPTGGGFGALHAIAEAPLAHDLIAAEGTRALVWSIDTIMDALDDDVPFALRWLREMAGRAQALASALPR